MFFRSHRKLQKELRRDPGAVRVLVGLGNPGSRYSQSRHNAGFRVVHILWERYGGDRTRRLCNATFQVGKKNGYRVLMMTPLSFMNLSGGPVKSLLERFSLDRRALLVIYDDMDMPVGRLRFRRNGSSGGHRGIASLIEFLGTREFDRLKIGIGNPNGSPSKDRSERDGDDMVDFVLGTPAPAEQAVFSQTEKTAADAAWFWVGTPVEHCMDVYNNHGKDHNLFAQEDKN